MNKIGRYIYRTEEFVRKVFYKIFRESVIKSSFGSCGKNVHIAEKSDIKGIGNISIGDDVAIGPHALLRHWAIPAVFWFVSPALSRSFV